MFFGIISENVSKIQIFILFFFLYSLVKDVFKGVKRDYRL